MGDGYGFYLFGMGEMDGGYWGEGRGGGCCLKYRGSRSCLLYRGSRGWCFYQNRGRGCHNWSYNWSNLSHLGNHRGRSCHCSHWKLLSLYRSFWHS